MKASELTKALENKPFSTVFKATLAYHLATFVYTVGFISALAIIITIYNLTNK